MHGWRSWAGQWNLSGEVDPGFDCSFQIGSRSKRLCWSTMGDSKVQTKGEKRQIQVLKELTSSAIDRGLNHEVNASSGRMVFYEDGVDDTSPGRARQCYDVRVVKPELVTITTRITPPVDGPERSLGEVCNEFNTRVRIGRLFHSDTSVYFAHSLHIQKDRKVACDTFHYCLEEMQSITPDVQNVIDGGDYPFDIDCC